MVFEHLKVRPGQRATSAWANTLIDILEMLYGLGRRGEPDNPFHELYGYYGYFFYDLYVQGRRVIKDGDPINLYDIFEPAKQKITQAIDQSLLTNIRTAPYAPLLRTVIREELAPRREAPEKVLDAVSIGGGGLEEFIVMSTERYSALAVTVKATYDASAVAGVRVRWLYSPDGSNFDSPEDAESAGNYEDLTFEAGKTRQRTMLIPLFTPYVKVEIVNLDKVYPVIVDAWTTLLR